MYAKNPAYNLNYLLLFYKTFVSKCVPLIKSDQCHQLSVCTCVLSHLSEVLVTLNAKLASLLL